MKLGTVIATQEIEQMAGGDVTAEALDRGWIHEFAEGQYIYGAPWVRLLRKLQSAVLDRAAELGFEEWLLPPQPVRTGAARSRRHRRRSSA